MTTLMVIMLGIFLLVAEPDTTSPDTIIKQLLLQAEDKFENKDEEGALELYMEVLNHDPEHFEALWNASLNYTRIGFRFDDEDRKKSYFENAIELAEKAVEHHPKEAESHYVKAVAVGRMTDLIGTRRRITSAHDIQNSVEKAIELDPNYAPAWHLYGVWHSEVANVGRAERWAARFISRGIPSGATNETAEEYLQKAIDLDPDNILTRLDLARHYVRIGQDDKAIPILENIQEMEPEVKDDPRHLQEAEKLLSDLQ